MKRSENEFVPFSTSLNAEPGGAGAIDASASGGFSRVLVAGLLVVGAAVLAVIGTPPVDRDVPCDTSPGGLLRTITPRSMYNTPGLGRLTRP